MPKTNEKKPSYLWHIANILVTFFYTCEILETVRDQDTTLVWMIEGWLEMRLIGFQIFFSLAVFRQKFKKIKFFKKFRMFLWTFFQYCEQFCSSIRCTEILTFNFWIISISFLQESIFATDYNTRNGRPCCYSNKSLVIKLETEGSLFQEVFIPIVQY